jgi:hypothetical protein
MASSKKGVTATLGTFSIDLELKKAYKIACMEDGVSMTDELTQHIKDVVSAHRTKKGTPDVAE